MKAVVTIARRELQAYLVSPVSYLVVALFLLVQGYSFWLFIKLLAQAGGPHGAVMQYFFGGTFLYWLLVMFLVAILTMRLIAEERRLGTLEPLLTAPVDEVDVVLGKYLGALVFWALLWAPTLLYVVVLRAYAPDAPDPGPIAAGYLGTLLVGASALAVGVCASALTRYQILAAILCAVVFELLLLVPALEGVMRSSAWAGLLRHVNLFRHMEDFGRGIVDTRHVVYHLSLAALFLFGAVRALEWKRGR
jgi:ABC-2 type transport system permease protein